MAILSKYNLDKYKYDTDVRKKHQLYGMSGKIIYEGRWRSRRTDPIIIVEMNEAIAEREAHFYLEVNNHDNIIRTLGYVENSENLTIFIQEFAKFNDLAGVLMDNQFNISQTILIEMFLQIADAMSYVARKKIVHGDLGCRNVLVFQVDPSEPKNNLVKITDFGLARWIDRPPANEDPTILPIRYCAPEILRHNRHSSYSEKSDVYSMGVLIWEALSNGEFPYSSVDDDTRVAQMKLDDKKLKQPSICDGRLWALMNDCWYKDREERPTFDEIKDELSKIKNSEVLDAGTTASPHKARIRCNYELDTDVEIKNLLNNGYPSIYEAQWKTEEDERPILLIEKNEIPSEHEKLFYRTFKNHPHIVHTFGFVKNDRGSIMILQERAPHGNLQSLLETGQFQPSARVLVEIFSQIINAMIDIVNQGLVHGDLRCENILVFQMHPSDPKRNLVKLSNFTLVHPNDPSHTDERRLFVPVRYCALEILRSAGRSNYSELSDVYSMGVLMWQACSKGKRPYDSSETSNEVRQRKLKGEKLPRPVVCDDQIWSIMTDCCLHNSPEVRFTFEEMKIQFSKINFESVEPHQYELDKNVKQKRPLNGMNGRFYEAEWIPKKDQPILLFVIDGPAAEHEALLYIELNSHPYIIRTFGLVKNDRQSVMLLQERAPHGDLQTLLQSGNFQPSPKILVTIFLQIVDAMIYVSHQGIVHGDLRCANILVFEMDSSEPKRNLVKLTSFSLARRKDQSFANNRLPDSHVRYCAPEILRSEDGSNYSELSDVYSMGVLMCEACSKGEVPYGRHTSDHDVRQRRFINAKLPKPKECHSQIWSVIEGCCYDESSLRLTFEELKAQLDKVDLNIIDRIHCSRCKKDIPENEMPDHQISCSRKRTVGDGQPADRIHFTRCNYCGERCLGSELDEHQQSCPSRLPRTTDFKPILSVRCDYCGQEFRSNEIIHHQDSCASRSTPPLGPRRLRLIRCRYCDEEYLDSEIAHHRKSCPSRPEPPAPQKQCIHCHRQYPLSEIQNHEASCPSKPVPLVPPPSEPVDKKQCSYCHHRYTLAEIQNHEKTCPSRPITHPPLEPVHQIECKYCHQKYPTNNIKSHEGSCTANPVPRAPHPPKYVLSQCIYCYQQYPPNRIETHQNACPSKPKSYMDQLSSWLCCCCCPKK